MRVFLDIRYNGANYHGWQQQDNAHTVQQEIQDRLSQLLGTQTDLLASGRTDAGVHARQQIAHLTLPENTDLDLFQHKLNTMLPGDVAIVSIRKVTDVAHARFDAVSRSYEYHLHEKKDPFLTGLSYYFRPELDIARIRDGCQVFLVNTNFESFSKVKTDVKTFECSITDCRWEKTDVGYVYHVSANRFLRGMVRAMVGTLIELGLGKITVPELQTILNKRDRRMAGTSVPPDGLYLTQVTYPDHIYLN